MPQLVDVVLHLVAASVSNSCDAAAAAAVAAGGSSSSSRRQQQQQAAVGSSVSASQMGRFKAKPWRSVTCSIVCCVRGGEIVTSVDT
jgi:hypothetical protein